MTAAERKKAVISILVTQLRDEYDAYVSLEHYRGKVTAIGLAVPFYNREKAFPLFNILKMYVAPAYTHRRRKKKK